MAKPTDVQGEGYDAEVNRLAQELDVSPARVRKSLESLQAKGLIAPAHPQAEARPSEDAEELDKLASRFARGEMIGGTPYAQQMAEVLCRAADRLAENVRLAGEVARLNLVLETTRAQRNTQRLATEREAQARQAAESKLSVLVEEMAGVVAAARAVLAQHAERYGGLLADSAHGRLWTAIAGLKAQSGGDNGQRS